MKRARDDQAQSGATGKRAGSGQRPGANLQTKLTTSDALSYLREVKNRFSDNKDVYDTFLEIMKEFKGQRIDTAGVIGRVKKLFKGHRELILGFNTFLPKGYEIELARISDDEEEEEAPGKGEFIQKQPVEFDQAINYVNKIKNRFANDDRVYKAFLEILNMYRKGQKTIHSVYNEVAVLFRTHNDLLDEFTYFLPDAQAVHKDHQRRQAGFRSGSRPPAAQVASTADMRSMHKRKAARKAEEGFKAGYGFDDQVEPRKAPLARELQYFERVKAKLRNPSAYNDMIKCIHLYNQEIISRGELVALVNDIIGKYPDLMAGFHEFLVKCETMDTDMSATLNRTGAPVIAPSQRDALRQKASALPKDKLLSKPLSEIVAHETERVTPSYVKIPAGYPKLAQAGLTELGNEALNMTYVNVITGSEDYSFKLMRKNQYEEALFRCEDDRYEFEMCIETNNSAMRALRPLLDLINALPAEERAAYKLEEGALSPVHVKAIDNLYGDASPVLLDLLRKNPLVAIPTVLARMEQKDAEWRKVKEEMTKVWRKIYEQNYHKSLDHRSFYFKQAEKKQLLPKTMVQEIREVADARRQEEQHLRCLSLARRYESLSAPHLSYDYGEKSVFEDCWAILRTAVEESRGSGPREQVMELYLDMVEPLFCLPPRAEELARVKGKSKPGHFVVRASKDKDKEGPDADTKSEDLSDREGMDTDAMEGVEQAGKGTSKASSPEPGAGPETSGADMDEGREEGSARDDAAESMEREHPGRTYTGCKPMAPYMGASQGAGEGPSPASTRLLLANEMMYVFLRYHRHLYDRLRIARQCALQQAQKSSQQQMRQVAAPVMDAGEVVEAGQNAEGAVREEAARLHGTFMGMTQQLLTGELEISLFEDQVRALLGTNSYELFTLDKLIHKLLNHMRMMVQDEQTMKLWELFRYEHSRGTGINAVAYHINSHAVLDDTCYRIEYKDSSAEMTVALVETDKAESLSAVEGYITEYIRAYLSDPATRAPEGGQLLFLRRNLKAKLKEGGEEDVAAALQQVSVCNGLECKISCSTTKVSYVLETEDIMCRGQRHISGVTWRCKLSRSSRMAQWVEGRVQQMNADKMTDMLGRKEKGEREMPAAPAPAENVQR